MGARFKDPVHVNVEDMAATRERLTLEELGAFATLLALYFSGQDLSNDDAKMATLLAVRPSIWRRVKPKVMAEFDTTGPTWRPLIRFVGELDRPS